MFKFNTLPSSLWAFDGEWIPDQNLGKRLYNLPQEISEAEVWQAMDTLGECAIGSLIQSIIKS